MTVKDCILSADRQGLLTKFKERFDDPESEDQYVEEERERIFCDMFDRLIDDISGREVKESANKLVVRFSVYEFVNGENTYSFDTYIVDPDGNDFSLLYMDWDDVLSLSIEDLTLELNKELIAACVLYEMTWFGWTEEEMGWHRKETFGEENDLDCNTYINPEEMWSDICETD